MIVNTACRVWFALPYNALCMYEMSSPVQLTQEDLRESAIVSSIKQL